MTKHEQPLTAWMGVLNDGYSNRTNTFNESRRLQEGRSDIIWEEIVGNEMIDSIKIAEGVKVTAATHCDMPEFVLRPWLEDLPLSLV